VGPPKYGKWVHSLSGIAFFEIIPPKTAYGAKVRCLPPGPIPSLLGSSRHRRSHPRRNLGIREDDLRVFQPFFISLDLPYSLLIRSGGGSFKQADNNYEEVMMLCIGQIMPCVYPVF